MSNDYYDVYKRRINRYGTNPQERLENARRENFERFLSQSPHYVKFKHGRKIIEAVLEPKRQNQSRTLFDLLCSVSVKFTSGTILYINKKPHMVYFQNERSNSGYNSYVLVKITHKINWKNKEGNTEWSYAYMYFQEDRMLRETVRSKSGGSLYLEDMKLNFLLMPLNKKLEVGTYIEITTKGISQFFVVTGYDIVSTPGAMYVSMDPTFKRDLTPAPTPDQGEGVPENFFWLMGEEIKEDDD